MAMASDIFRDACDHTCWDQDTTEEVLLDYIEKLLTDEKAEKAFKTYLLGRVADWRANLDPDQR